MKQYSQANQPLSFAFRQGKNEFFFEPASFFKSKQNPPSENVHLKWFSQTSNGFFVLAIKGIDAQTFKEILMVLKSKSKLNHYNGEANTLSEMMASVNELAETPKTYSCAAENPTGLWTDYPSEFLQVVDKKIEENLGDEHFRGSDLAKLLCCCEMQLYRKIKQFSKLSPANYIRRYRLRRSLQSLKETDLSISQVCLNMGFKSLEYFSRSFKKEFGICPSDFRSGRMLE